jgi:hypothetical protein
VSYHSILQCGKGWNPHARSWTTGSNFVENTIFRPIKNQDSATIGFGIIHPKSVNLNSPGRIVSGISGKVG